MDSKNPGKSRTQRERLYSKYTDYLKLVEYINKYQLPERKSDLVQIASTLKEAKEYIRRLDNGEEINTIDDFIKHNFPTINHSLVYGYSSEEKEEKVQAVIEEVREIFNVLENYKATEAGQEATNNIKTKILPLIKKVKSTDFMPVPKFSYPELKVRNKDRDRDIGEKDIVMH